MKIVNAKLFLGLCLFGVIGMQGCDGIGGVMDSSQKETQKETKEAPKQEAKDRCKEISKEDKEVLVKAKAEGVTELNEVMGRLRVIHNDEAEMPAVGTVMECYHSLR